MADYFAPPLLPGSHVWAYLRDSGGPTQENSVTQQESEVRAYCVRYGLILIEVFKDVAKSGGSVVSRDDFERMIDMSKVKEHRPAGLLLWNFARFSRDSIDATYYKASLRKDGILIHSLTDPIPADEFGSRIVETVIDLANEEKRRQNSRDVKRGLASLVEKGFAPGTPPRGYTRVQVDIGLKRDGSPRMVSKWKRDPELWELIVMAWTMRADGRSYQEIQKATGGRVYKTLPCWAGFFKNKNYLGIYTHGGKEYPDHHEPAVTWEVWKAVQELHDAHPLRAGNLRHPRRVGTPSLLSGFTYCIECGSMMVHGKGSHAKPWHFYICGRKDRQGANACISRRVGESNSETAILNAVINQVLSPEFLETALQIACAKYCDSADIEKQIARVKKDIESLDLAIQRSLNAIERTGSEAAYQRHEQRERERAIARAKLNELEAQLVVSKLEITPEAMQVIAETWKEQLTLARATNDIRLTKTWLMRFVSRVELGYNTARIFYTYPMIDFSLDSLIVSRSRGGTPLETQY